MGMHRIGDGFKCTLSQVLKFMISISSQGAPFRMSWKIQRIWLQLWSGEQLKSLVRCDAKVLCLLVRLAMWSSLHTVCKAICGFLIDVLWNDSVVSRARSTSCFQCVSVCFLGVFSGGLVTCEKFHWGCILMLCIECSFSDTFCVAMDNLRRS